MTLQVGGFPDNFDNSRNVRYVSGKFFANGSSAFATTTGTNFTATRTGVGTATCLVSIQASRVLHSQFRLHGAKAALFLQDVTETHNSDGSYTFGIAITTMDGTTGAEFPAADANAFVSFFVVLQIGDTP